VTTGSIGKDRNSIICTACGAANPPGSRFCERCGTRLPQQPSGNQPPHIMPAPTTPPSSAQEPAPRLAASDAPSAPPAPDPTPAREEAAQASPSREEAPTPPVSPDSPTVTIELAPTREITRNAPTETFELPRESRPANDEPTATPTPPGTPPPAGDQPTQIGSGWGYRSWTPPASQAAAAEPGNTPPAAPPREPAPTPPTPPAEVTQVVRPTSDVGGAPQERVSAPEESPFVAPTTAPLTYPSGGTASNAAPERVGQPYGGGGANGGGVGRRCPPTHRLHGERGTISRPGKRLQQPHPLDHPRRGRRAHAAMYHHLPVDRRRRRRRRIWHRRCGDERCHGYAPLGHGHSLYAR